MHPDNYLATATAAATAAATAVYAAASTMAAGVGTRTAAGRLQHHLQLDTTAGSLQDHPQRVLQFVAGLNAGSAAIFEQEQARQGAHAAAALSCLSSMCLLLAAAPRCHKEYELMRVATISRGVGRSCSQST
jgi:hypothetical protein